MASQTAGEDTIDIEALEGGHDQIEVSRLPSPPSKSTTQELQHQTESRPDTSTTHTNSLSAATETMEGEGESVPGSFASSILSLTKKNPRIQQPKLSSDGVLNPFNNPYGNVGVNNSDGESSDSTDDEGQYGDDDSDDGDNDDNDDNDDDESSMMSDVQNGYNLPSALSSFHTNTRPQHFLSHRNDQGNESDSEDDDDEASTRTPIPKAPPLRLGDAILPSTFLRSRSNSKSNLSDISSDDSTSSQHKRQKREEQNVGRLVLAAKQQQSFAQAWFQAGSQQNALPEMMGRKGSKKGRIPSNAPPGLKLQSIEVKKKKESGPIDLDSGEVWDEDGDEMDDGKTKKTGLHSAKTKKQSNKGFITFGVPDDEDLTHYTERKGLDKIVCTVGNTRCSLLAMLIITTLGALAVGSAIGAGIYFTPSNNSSARESTTRLPTFRPTSKPTDRPSIKPTDRPSTRPSLRPTDEPSISPTDRPSIEPSYDPTSAPSTRPSNLPSSIPSDEPSTSPSTSPSDIPSTLPSISPSTSPSISQSPTLIYNYTSFSQIGSDLAVTTDIFLEDEHGYSISLSSDGSILAVGARYFPDDLGSVTVYRLNNDDNVGMVWREMGERLVGLNATNEFGYSVDLSGDGMVLAVGEPVYDGENGLVRVFSYDEDINEWIDYGGSIFGEGGGAFGHVVSLSDDGKRLAVGAPEMVYNTGQVTAYQYDDETGMWEQIGLRLNGGDIFEEFGYDVSLSGDGNVLACGAPSWNGRMGAVHVYEWFEEGGDIGWRETDGSPLTHNMFEFGRFGFSVSLSYDGSRMATGSPNSGDNAGEAAVFDYSTNGFGWTQVGSDLLGDTGSEQQFGYSVSLSRSGTHVAIGAPRHTVDTDVYQGLVAVYRWTGGSWGDAVTVDGSSRNEEFGHDVTLADDAAVLAASGPSALSHENFGIARVFRWEGG